MAYIGFCPLPGPLIPAIILFQLCGHDSKIMCRMSLLPGALEIKGIDSAVSEYIVCRMSIIMNHASAASIQARAVPPVS